jgi:hypothetical protein
MSPQKELSPFQTEIQNRPVSPFHPDMCRLLCNLALREV